MKGAKKLMSLNIHSTSNLWRKSRNL